MDKIVLIISKIGTIFVDRRFLEAVATVLLVAFGVPEGKYTAEITQVGMFLTSLALMLSWTVRPPSGLKFKELLELDTVLSIFGVTKPEQK